MDFFLIFYLGHLGFDVLVETEQDEGLERLEESVTSTKHIALAVNEELTLHTRLIVCFFTYISFGFLLKVII